MKSIYSGKLLANIMYGVLSLWIIAQVFVLIFFWGKPQDSDPGTYLQVAKICFDNNEWYPNTKHIYSQYIFAPGLINFLILQLKLFGTVNTNSLFNFLMNIGIVAEIYYLGKRFFNQKTARISVILWCLMYSNVIIIAVAGTEIPFLFLSLTAFCLCLSKKTAYLIFAGVFFALANWIRPLIIIFVPSVLLYMFLQKFKVAKYAYLLIPLIITTLVIGKTTQLRMGYFNFQSTTSGVNLIMTSNDKAYGGVATTILLDSTSIAYIKNEKSFTFLQRDSIWKARSITWIKSHPLKAVGLYIKKLGGIYVEDSWADRPILGGAGFLDSYVNNSAVSDENFRLEIIKRGAKSLIYFMVLLLFFYSIWIHRKALLSEKGILLLILIFGTLLTAIFAVSPRYHYPFAFVLVLFAAYGIATGFKKLKND